VTKAILHPLLYKSFFFNSSYHDFNGARWSAGGLNTEYGTSYTSIKIGVALTRRNGRKYMRCELFLAFNQFLHNFVKWKLYARF
jgi:hypothetical protein